MWGGRFAEGPAAVMREINASIPFDKRLWKQDIAGSKAHVAMLGKQGIVSAEDAATIAAGLDKVAEDYAANGVAEDLTLEDIHMQTEAKLAQLIGPVAGRLHTARSRNDQVATDFRLWVRDAIDETLTALGALREALLIRAEEHADSVMPGFTHLQSAQPVTLGHHLMAYHEMIVRDASRFADARARMNQCPLGSAALAGTGFPIDRHMTAEALGFDAPTRNSLDAVSDRDFAIDYLQAATNCSLHLSRLAEEFVLWASQPFGFVALSDQWSTGSSIMPQKRNPDAAELVRGHAGRIMGCMTSRTPRMRAVAEAGFSTATDLADWLVRVGGIPFREAHHITGRAVKLAEEKGVMLHELSIDDLTAIDARINDGIYDVLSVDASVASRVSFGGTAPANVRAAIATARGVRP